MVYRVIGLMSGSSLDGLDIAYVELEEKGGTWTHRILDATCIPYEDAWVQRLRDAVQLNAFDHADLHAAYGHLVGKMVKGFIAERQLEYKVALVASHGHTSFHVPGKFSVQLGDGAAIAAETGLPVVSELRAMDLALGGQGAPIVPMGEKLLFPSHLFFLNIGGIANISFNGGAYYTAFDVCAANRVLNMLSKERGMSFDEHGDLAAAGRIHEGLLEQLNALEYFTKEYPKSLDNSFGTDQVFPLIQSFGISLEDRLATTCEHIAIQVARSVAEIEKNNGQPIGGQQMLVTGGGALNTYLVSRIRLHLNPMELAVEIPDAVTINYKEALIMALLGVLRWREEDTVMAEVTGASRSSIGGALWMGSH